MGRFYFNANRPTTWCVHNHETSPPLLPLSVSHPPFLKGGASRSEAGGSYSPARNAAKFTLLSIPNFFLMLLR